MSFLSRFFRKKRKVPALAPPVLTPPLSSPPPPGAPETIKAWDAYGRIVEIPRERWRIAVLPANFRQAWNRPDDLANLIHNALKDGFVADCLEPARQLHRVDYQPRRAAAYLSAVLLHVKNHDEAAKIINEAVQLHGEDGLLLVNLAKVQHAQGHEALAERTLWQAIQADPNLDNALLWYETIQRERDGESAGLDALRRVAALPGSWRAQLLLARHALQTRQLEQALALYEECLARAGDPAPGDLLQQLTGDLGNAGHLPELLRLAGSRFDPKLHGLSVGNNLVKACVDLGQLDAARRRLDQLYAQNRADWRESLAYWDTEITKARIAISGDPRAPMKMAMLAIEGPVWLKPDSPAAELFPDRTGKVPVVAFLAGSVAIATNSKRVQTQMADTPGGLSRALPLFLAEQTGFLVQARTETLVPWIIGETAAFGVGGGPWIDADAAQYARQAELKADFVVTTHIDTTTEPWVISLRLVRTIDAKCLRVVGGSTPSAQPDKGIPALARQLLAMLSEEAGTGPAPVATLYQVPPAPWFGSYLLRLEQLLSVRCAGMEGEHRGSLNGERDILDGMLQLSLAFPGNTGARLLLAETLRAMKRARPEVPPEFKTKIELLQRAHPLPKPAQGIVQRMLREVFIP